MIGNGDLEVNKNNNTTPAGQRLPQPTSKPIRHWMICPPSVAPALISPSDDKPRGEGSLDEGNWASPTTPTASFLGNWGYLRGRYLSPSNDHNRSVLHTGSPKPHTSPNEHCYIPLRPLGSILVSCIQDDSGPQFGSSTQSKHQQSSFNSGDPRIRLASRPHQNHN